MHRLRGHTAHGGAAGWDLIWDSQCQASQPGCSVFSLWDGVQVVVQVVVVVVLWCLSLFVPSWLYIYISGPFGRPLPCLAPLILFHNLSTYYVYSEFVISSSR